MAPKINMKKIEKKQAQRDEYIRLIMLRNSTEENLIKMMNDLLNNYVKDLKPEVLLEYFPKEQIPNEIILLYKKNRNAQGLSTRIPSKKKIDDNVFLLLLKSDTALLDALENKQINIYTNLKLDKSLINYGELKIDLRKHSIPKKQLPLLPPLPPLPGTPPKGIPPLPKFLPPLPPPPPPPKKKTPPPPPKKKTPPPPKKKTPPPPPPKRRLSSFLFGRLKKLLPQFAKQKLVAEEEVKKIGIPPPPPPRPGSKKSKDFKMAKLTTMGIKPQNAREEVVAKEYSLDIQPFGIPPPPPPPQFRQETNNKKPKSKDLEAAMKLLKKAKQESKQESRKDNKKPKSKDLEAAMKLLKKLSKKQDNKKKQSPGGLEKALKERFRAMQSQEELAKNDDYEWQ